MGKHRLEAIFFDIDDTLYSSSGFAYRARSRSVEAMIAKGLKVEEERVHSLIREIIGEHDSNFQYQFDEALKRLPPESYEPVNPAVIVSAAIAAYHDTKFRELQPFEDVVPLLKRMRCEDIRLGIVTQGIPVKQAEKLIRTGLLDFFEPAWIFVSEQLVAKTKEGVDMWREVADKAQIDPSRCMYVGDHPVKDVSGPMEAGYVTVLVKRGGNVKLACVKGKAKASPASLTVRLAEL